MREIIDGAICWEAIGDENRDKTEYKFTLGKGVIHKDTGVLTLPVTLNFVMPFLDCEKIKAVILHKLDMLKDVEFDFTYEDMILTDEEIIGLYIPHMIHVLNGSFVAITKAIDEKNFELEDDRLTIYSLGNVATEQLNLNGGALQVVLEGGVHAQVSGVLAVGHGYQFDYLCFQFLAFHNKNLLYRLFM